MSDEENLRINDVLFQIDMQLYDEFNDTIATMNDHLGDIYSLRDVEEVEKAQKDREIELLRKAIVKQQKEIEHQKEKRENQKKELAILNEKQKEFNKLVNTVNSYKGQFKRQQKEIEELKEADLTIVYLDGVYYGEKKWENKIKAKIEEYKKLINECPMNNEEIFCKECTEKCGFNQTIDVLQSLLEKE